MNMGMEKDLKELVYGISKLQRTWFSLLLRIPSGNVFLVMEVLLYHSVDFFRIKQ